MSLAGELEAAKRYQPNRPKCTVCTYVLTLDDADRLALIDAFASDLLTTAIHAAIERAGANFALSTLQRHRNGRCRGITA